MKYVKSSSLLCPPSGSMNEAMSLRRNDNKVKLLEIIELGNKYPSGGKQLNLRITNKQTKKLLFEIELNQDV